MTKPQFTVTAQKAGPSSARFIIEPLPQGFGHTLGNSLRRALYSSIPGAAITSVSVPGAPHQFTTLPGVKEDIVQLILNLKQIRLSYRGDKPVKISLSAKGPGQVTADRFATPPEIKIANPELVLAHLADKNSKLEIDATIEAGFGYSPAEDRKSSTLGLIPVDAIFTPVSRVNYTVETTRVGRVTNFDKLILDVSTDGTISPQSALQSAASTLVDYFSSIVHPQSAAPDAAHTAVGPAVSAGTHLSIEELDLPTRISNALLKSGFETVSDLLALPKSDLAKVKNLGVKSVKIIELALRDRGFELN